MQELRAFAGAVEVVDSFGSLVLLGVQGGGSRQWVVVSGCRQRTVEAGYCVGCRGGRDQVGVLGREKKESNAFFC